MESYLLYPGQEVVLVLLNGDRYDVVILEVDRKQHRAYVEHESERCEWVNAEQLEEEGD